MQENSAQDASAAGPQTADLIRKRVGQIAFVAVAQAAALFLAAGRLDWPAAWAYLGAYVGVAVANGLFLLRRQPELVAERARVKEGAKRWDPPLAAVVSLLGPLAVLVVAGLDVRRRWSRGLPWPLRVGALATMILGYLLVVWAMVANRFFSGVVRIQTECGHVVVNGGPYRFVRHPGYSGMGTHLLATPALLGSRWAFLPALLTVAVLVLRTALEDRTLRKELPGYADYARGVRHRLLPGIW